MTGARYDRNGRISSEELEKLKREQTQRRAEAEAIAEDLLQSLIRAEHEIEQSLVTAGNRRA